MGRRSSTKKQKGKIEKEKRNGKKKSGTWEGLDLREEDKNGNKKTSLQKRLQKLQKLKMAK